MGKSSRNDAMMELSNTVEDEKTKEYKIKESMTAFENKLSDTFFRVHRSYLVSLKAITKISRTCVTIEGMIE